MTKRDVKELDRMFCPYDGGECKNAGKCEESKCEYFIIIQDLRKIDTDSAVYWE